MTKIKHAFLSDNTPSDLQFKLNYDDNSIVGVDTNIDTNLHKESNTIENNFHKDTLDNNQDLLYEPNQFNVPDTTNKVNSNQENANTFKEVPLTIQ